MNKTIIAKLDTILEHYQKTYQVSEDINTIREELIVNDVEVNGDSFYCPIWSEEVNAWVLLAGTKDKADMWVLKKIIKLIKTGQPIYSLFNGNSEYLLKAFKRYGVKCLSQDGEMAYITLNI